MPNPYITPQQLLDWMPQRFIAELTDDTGGITPSNPRVQDALDDAAEELDSGLLIRDDIPVPALNADGTTPTRVRQFMMRVALYNLYSRRGFVNDTVRENFDIEMTWLNQVINRQKNIKVASATGRNTTPTTEQPVVGFGPFERRKKTRRLFDKWTF